MTLNEIINVMIDVSRDPMIRIIVPIAGLAIIVEKCL